MRINEIYSHSNGKEYLQARRPLLWREIESVIERLRPSRLASKTRYSSRLTENIDRVQIFKALKYEFRRAGWNSSQIVSWTTTDAAATLRVIEQDCHKQRTLLEEAGLVALPAYSKMELVKERVAVDIGFKSRSEVAYSLYVKQVAFYISDRIDVGIEILPMKSLQSRMSSGVAYYEGELYNVIRQGRGVPAVPLVIIGIEP